MEKPKPNNESELPRVDEMTVNRVDESSAEEERRFLTQGEQTETTGVESFDESGSDEPGSGTEENEGASITEDPAKESGKETGQSKQDSEGKEETFVDSSELPDELKPAYKNMQAAFTKAMQGIPKEYRGEKFKEVMEKSKAWDEVESDSKLAQMIEDYLVDKKGLPRGKAESKKETAVLGEDAVKDLLPDATKIDRHFLNRYAPVFQKMIEKGLSPLADDLYAGREKQLYDNLQKKYGIDVAPLKPKIKALLKEIPDITHEEAFKVVAFEDLRTKAKSEGVAEAEAQSKRRESSFVAGGRRSESAETPNFQKMSLAEMTNHLPRASRD